MEINLYFRTSDSEICYPLKYHMEQAKIYGLSEIELFEAIPDNTPGYFFCREFGQIGEDGSCGIQCDRYSPRNGRSGMCRHRSNQMYEHGRLVKFETF